MSSSSILPQIHILIVGTGAVGAFYGSRLHQPCLGVFVSFTCRSNYAEVAAHGLELETASFGSYRLTPHRVFNSVSAACAGPGPDRGWDFVVLCTKVLPDRVDDPALVAPLFTGREKVPTLVLIQNGVGFEDAHRTRHPHVPLLSAVTVVNAEQLKPALVRQNAWTRISIGPYVSFSYEQSVAREPVDQALVVACERQAEVLVRLLKQGGIKDASIYSERELQMVRWHKLAINASMNPSSILCGGLTNNEMVSRPALRDHLAGCIGEILEATLKIFGVSQLPAHFATVDQILRSLERAGQKGDIKPSMLVDWEQNRPLETEVILGIPIRIARRAGVELNRIQTMYAFLIELQVSRAKNPDRSLLAKI